MNKQNEEDWQKEYEELFKIFHIKRSAGLKLGKISERTEIILKSTKLVHNAINKYFNSFSEDLYQNGVVGLINAVDTYTLPAEGQQIEANFSTYATTCIRNQILLYFRSIKKLVPAVSYSNYICNEEDGGVFESFLDNPEAQEELNYICEKDYARFILLKLNYFSPRTQGIFCNYYGLCGLEKLDFEQMSAKYGINNISTLHSILFKMRNKMKILLNLQPATPNLNKNEDKIYGYIPEVEAYLFSSNKKCKINAYVGAQSLASVTKDEENNK